MKSPAEKCACCGAPKPTRRHLGMVLSLPLCARCWRTRDEMKAKAASAAASKVAGDALPENAAIDCQ